MYKTNEQKRAAKAALLQARAQVCPVIKVGIDAHLNQLVIAVQEDETGAKAPRKVSADGLLGLVHEWRAKPAAVFCCYEAGPLGFGLQRRLAAAGALCFVVRPRVLNEYGLRVKTDRRDAAGLLANLDRYLSGNDLALAPVALPTEAEERRRFLARERQHLAGERQSQVQHFRGTCLYAGVAMQGKWWRKQTWAKYRELLPPELVAQGERLLVRVAQFDQDLKQIEAELSADLPAERPAGLGELTTALIDREIVAWDRFARRQQVASYTGLVPSESSSGGHRLQGSITKQGNRSLRHLLVEAAWRMVRFQPGYRRVRKWQCVFDDPRAGGARRKKAIVALARQLAVDLWRWRTGRVTLVDLGLRPAV